MIIDKGKRTRSWV